MGMLSGDISIVEVLDLIGDDIVIANRAFDRYSGNSSSSGSNNSSSSGGTAMISLWGMYCALETALKIDLSIAIQNMNNNHSDYATTNSKQSLLYSYFLDNGYISSTYDNYDSTTSSDLYHIRFSYIHYLYFYLKLKNINNDTNDMKVLSTTSDSKIQVINSSNDDKKDDKISEEMTTKENEDKVKKTSLLKEDSLDPIRRARIRFFSNNNSNNNNSILTGIISNNNIKQLEANTIHKSSTKDAITTISTKTEHQLLLLPVSTMDPLYWFRTIDFWETMESLCYCIETKTKMLTKERNLSYEMIFKIFRNMDLNNIYGNDDNNTNDNDSKDINTRIYLTDLNQFILRVTLWKILPDNWFHEQLLSFRVSLNITTNDNITWEEINIFINRWLGLVIKRELKALRNQVAKEIWKNIKAKALKTVTNDICKKNKVIIIRKYRKPLDC